MRWGYDAASRLHKALRMTRPRRDDELSRIAETIRRSGGRSPLYRWLKSRHDEFAALLAEKGGRPDWQALSDEFAAMGIMGGNGQPVSPEAARHTWWRVRRDVAQAMARRTKAASPAAALMAPARPTQPPAPAPSPGSADALARLRAEMDQRSGRG
jgi:hypothetical protein